MMAEGKETWASGGGRKLNTEECSQQDINCNRMHEYTLQILVSVMSKLERTQDKSQETNLSKMKRLHATLTNSKNKIKIETLMKCKDILKKLMDKVDKVPHRQEFSSAETNQGDTTVVGGELSNIATRRDRSESREDNIIQNSTTETPSQNLQAAESSSSNLCSASDGASPNNEWLPSHKSSPALQHMLGLDSLRNLYKCMDRKCYWTENSARRFIRHIRIEHFNKMQSRWNQCSYCSFRGDGTPRGLVQHIKKKHGYCLYQCAYCFFRGMACSYVVLHQNMFHTNKQVRVLQCNDLKVSPPAESELEPLESVVQPYICSQESCGKIYYNPKDFQLHLQQQHERESSLTCHICKATRMKAASLVSHYKFHSLSLYQCRHCPYGAEKEEEIHQHLCLMHHNLPPLTVLRHCEPTQQPASDVNQLKSVNLDQCVLADVISGASELTVGEVKTDIQSEISAEEGAVDRNEAAEIELFCQMTESEMDDIVRNDSFEMVDNQVSEAAQEYAVSPISNNAFLQEVSPLKISSSLQETNTKVEFSESSPYRTQNAEENDDNNDDSLDEDDDIQVLYCQLAVRDKHCNHVNYKGSCELRNSQPGKESPVSEIIIETDNQNSPDSVILLTDSSPEVTAKEESKLTQEHSTDEPFLVPTRNRFNSQVSIRNAESGPDTDSEFERNCCVESVNTTYSAEKPQTISTSEGSTVTEDRVTQGDRQKQFMVSGLTGKDLYLCGNAHCKYQAASKSLLRQHMYVCDLSHKGVLRCPHCSQSYKAFTKFINHLSVHGVARYSCALCPYSDPAPRAVEKHLKHHHKVSGTEIVPADMDMFIVSPKFQVKGISKHYSTENVVNIMYRPEEIHSLPMSGILKEPIHCSECSFKTKVFSDMKQHLALHLDRDVDPADIRTMEVSNPVERPEQNEKMLGKLTNLAASSNVGVPEMSSSVTSNSFSSALSADGASKSGKDVQDAAFTTTVKPTKQAGACRGKASARGLSEPLPSSSPVKEAQDAASTTTSRTKQARMSVHELPEPMDATAATPSQPSKRAAALRAMVSIRDLSEATDADVAAAITYQPEKRAAAVRAMASIRDLSELGITSSPISSPKGSDTEEPGLEKNLAFTSLQQNKEPTSEEQKISCKDCGKECINLHGLKMHIIKKHKSSAKWRCGYCRLEEASKTAIKEHCLIRHPGFPQLVKFNVGATSLTLNDLEEADRETEVPGLPTAETSHHCKQKRSQSALLKHHSESHSNKKLCITESTIHNFECYECCFVSFSLHVLRKHFESEHPDCEFRYIVKPLKLHCDRNDNVRRETFAMRHHSTISTLCDAGHFICMLCNARADTEEQFHMNHHSVQHPDAQPKYYFETVVREAKHMKFECQKCCFTSDNFEILKMHIQLHITAFQIWLSAQQCDLEGRVVRNKLSLTDSDFRELEPEHWKKFSIKGKLEHEKRLCPVVAVSEKKDIQSTPCRIRNVSHKSSASSSVSTRLPIKSLSANRPEENRAKISEIGHPSTESSYSCYGQSPSPVDEKKLTVFANYGGAVTRMSMSTFSKLHNIYPRVKVRDLKHEKLRPL